MVDVIIVDPPRDGINQKALEKIISCGAKTMVYISCNPKTQKRSISYLSRGILKKIEDGKISVSGMDSEGAVILGKTNEIRPMSVWNQSSHSASENGSTLISTNIR